MVCPQVTGLEAERDSSKALAAHLEQRARDEEVFSHSNPSLLPSFQSVVRRKEKPCCARERKGYLNTHQPTAADLGLFFSH